MHVDRSILGTTLGSVGHDGSYIFDVRSPIKSPQSKTRFRSPRRGSKSPVDTEFYNTKNLSFPSETYLKGAVWLGRNMFLLFEELCESIDVMRSKLLNDISSASHDSDIHRSNQRLTLLAASSINEVLSKLQKSKARAREILQVFTSNSKFVQYPFISDLY